jgi:D-alanine-D-alanine ligase
MKPGRVGVLMGGLSSERRVSLRTGEAVLDALHERGYDACPVFVDRDLDVALRQERIEVAFIALHGRYGEDGCVQGLLETLGIPYTGSDVLASALAMNKVRAKQMFRLHNLPTPPSYVLDRLDAESLAAVHGDFGFPVVIKPATEGSSVGVEIARDPGELAAATEQALCFDSQVLVERFVAGQEISVAVLGDRTLGAIEVIPGGELFDFASKHAGAECDYASPPGLSPARYRGVLNQGLRAHRALGCSGATRVDIIVSESGNEQVLEVNTLPPLAPGCLLPRIAGAAGLSFADLAEAILHGARLAAANRGNGDRRTARPRPWSGEERRVTTARHH